MAGKPIEQVQQENTDRWMAVPGVVGTGIGQCDDTPCILVFTAAHTDSVRQSIPSVVEGYPVVVRPIGPMRALEEQ